MRQTNLLHELIQASADHAAERIALTSGALALSYGELAAQCERFAAGLMALGLARAERVAVYLETRPEFVAACFGAAAAGGAFVPVNPLLKADQVGYILRDCNVRVLVTSAERLALLQPVLATCHDLRQVVVVGEPKEIPAVEGASVHRWRDRAPRAGHRVMNRHDRHLCVRHRAAKGVGASQHGDGRAQRGSYLGNRRRHLLAALAASFDAGLYHRLHAGARVCPLLPLPALSTRWCERCRLLQCRWIQLAQPANRASPIICATSPTPAGACRARLAAASACRAPGLS